MAEEQKQTTQERAKNTAKAAASAAAKKAAAMAAKSAATQAAGWLAGTLGISLLPVAGIFLGAVALIMIILIIIDYQCKESWTFWGFAEVTSWLTWTKSVCDIIKLK